jgi:hypothetical protein
MALQTSGAISLNQIHVEAGGSSGSIVSINDSDVRSLIGKSSGATSSFSQFYGASSSLDTQTVTVGAWAIANIYFSTAYYGYRQSPSNGAISDGTLNVASNRTIAGFSWNGITNLGLFLSGSASNSGWTTVTINGIALSRSSATFSTVSGNSRWLWNTQTTNPFGTTVGATKQAVFT